MFVHSLVVASRGSLIQCRHAHVFFAHFLFDAWLGMQFVVEKVEGQSWGSALHWQGLVLQLCHPEHRFPEKQPISQGFQNPNTLIKNLSKCNTLSTEMNKQSESIKELQ